MKTRAKHLLTIAIFGLCLAGLAKADLAGRINAIMGQPAQKRARFSIHIIDARSGKTVYTHNATKALVPASNMKIAITAAAIKYLGADYEYKTKVGLCDGALAIIGSGDPLLGDKITDAKHGRLPGWIFDDITAALKKNGTTAINNIIVDSSVFDDEHVHPTWPKKELNRWYACEVSGLNFNGNCIEITATKASGKVELSVDPPTDFVLLTNRVKPISKGTAAVGAYRNREPNKIIVRGRCKDKVGPFDVAIENPAAFFGFLLAENLAKSGISVRGQIIEKPLPDDCDFKALAEYNTPLADCLARCNKDSLGLAAEALLKTIAAADNPARKNGSWDRGRELVSAFLVSLGVDQNQFQIDDASGLSTKNKLSANAITKVLFHTYKSRNWNLYKDSLAVGGLDGTIDKYFKDDKYKGRIFGKTGYINSVKSFSGLCSTDHGDYFFSIIANNANSKTRNAINDIAQAIFE